MDDLSTSRRALLGALALALALVATPARGRLQPRPTCVACYVIDDAGRVLFARAARAPRPNASTTKIVTALVVRDEAEESEIVIVSAAASATPGGGLALEPGERYTVDELLHALLMSSSNDAAVALAEHVAGSHAAFVALMNERADDLGAIATHFTTAHGLDEPDHYSSARDLAAFAVELLADPYLAEIVATPAYVTTSGATAVAIENRNSFLEGYPGATGVKTGYTAGAGNVLVASAQRSGRTLIAVAMGSDDAAQDAISMLDAGFRELARTPLLTAGASVGTLVFDPGGATRVIAAATVRGPADPAEIVIAFEPNSQVTPPISIGQEVGTVEIRTLDGDLVGTEKAVAEVSVERAGESWVASLLANVLRVAGDLTGS